MSHRRFITCEKGLILFTTTFASLRMHQINQAIPAEVQVMLKILPRCSKVKIRTSLFTCWLCYATMLVDSKMRRCNTKAFGQNMLLLSFRILQQPFRILWAQNRRLQLERFKRNSIIRSISTNSVDMVLAYSWHIPSPDATKYLIAVKAQCLSIIRGILRTLKTFFYGRVDWPRGA